MGTFCPDASFEAFAHRGKLMAMNGYRQHAAECLSIADDITISPKNRLVLLAMAQAWLKLAQRAEANPDADIVQQPASPSSTRLTPSSLLAPRNSWCWQHAMPSLSCTFDASSPPPAGS